MTVRLFRWIAALVTVGIAVLAWFPSAGCAAAAGAEDLSLSVKVDKTTVNLGDPVTLTLTLGGDIAGVDLSRVEFPEEFVVGARSQSTNFSIRAGSMERSISLVYVLIPQKAGTFHLGPFTIEHQKKELKTEPIEITVKKPAVPPPSLQPQGERFTL